MHLLVVELKEGAYAVHVVFSNVLDVPRRFQLVLQHLEFCVVRRDPEQAFFVRVTQNIFCGLFDELRDWGCVAERFLFLATILSADLHWLHLLLEDRRLLAFRALSLTVLQILRLDLVDHHVV